MRIGIFGGTFDPVHTGHTKSANEVAKYLSLDKIFFVPGGEPPHKLDRRVSSAEDRVNMLRLATKSYPDFEVSTYEVEKSGYSFSVDTVLHFYNEYKGAEIFYIIGADVVGELTHWKDIDTLFKYAKFAVLHRPGFDGDDFAERVEAEKSLGADITVIDTEQIDISSNEIRTNTDKYREFLDEEVFTYIKEHELYSKVLPFDEDYATENMKLRLSEERFLHSLRVSKEAVRIAGLFGADKEKCRIAGLLHDCGKNVTMHQLYWLAPELVSLGLPENGGNPKIVHGPAGAVIAEKKYGIIDKEILEAIRCHVTGEPDMGIIAQIVFLADYTEPGRQGESFDRIRTALNECADNHEELYKAVVVGADESIKYVLQKGQILSPMTLLARNNFLQKLMEKTNEN